MQKTTFDAFIAELRALKDLLKAVHKKTVRDESLRERFRTLFRTWVSTIQPDLERQLQSKRDFYKLSAELETLAKLTSKIKHVSEYRNRLNRAISLANGLVLYLPTTSIQQVPYHVIGRDNLFTSGIPDLPVRLVPNPLIGWKRNFEAFINKHPFDRSVFIMIRYQRRNESLIAKIKSTLSRKGFEGILASDHRLTDDLYNPIACLFCCSKGLAIFDRPGAREVFNPNVAYELGMFHLLGRDCRILKHKSVNVLQSDILMKLYLPYSTIDDAETHIKDWLFDSD